MTAGFFTRRDLLTIGKAAAVAESLTQKYFDLAENEWKRDPYRILTRKQVDDTLYEQNALANVIRYGYRSRLGKDRSVKERYGVVLQDPNILLTLLRAQEQDLWTLGLYILTHELIHIVRFRKFNVDFFACAAERDREEQIVHGITGEILSNSTKDAYISSLYGSRTASAPKNLS